MSLKAASEPLPELAAYLAPFAAHFLRSESREDLERYTTGLLADIPRKNAQTMADALPNTHAQRLQELMTGIQWDERALNAQRIEQLRDEVRLGDGVLLIDDTGFPKKGASSVGVSQQYCGMLGKVCNCQVAVTSLYADPAVHWPLQAQLYLPKEWLEDPLRRFQAGIPETELFLTKGEIGLDLVDDARRLALPYDVVVSDAGYGDDSTFLGGLEARKEAYVVAIPCDFHVELIDAPEAGSRRVDAVLHDHPLSAWRTIRWREGSKGWLRHKFVALRAYRTLEGKRQQEGWLIGERPARGQRGQWRYYFSNLPETTPLAKLVDYAHRRWAIEQFHEDAKTLLGWADYQGRRWTGFHRHAVLVMLAYSFLQRKGWQQRQEASRSSGSRRDPFSPSARSTPAVAGAGASASH